MRASQLWRSSDWCQTNSTGFSRRWPMAWKASWSQLDPGKTTTPNFMGTSGSDAGRFILAQRREAHRRDAEGAEKEEVRLVDSQGHDLSCPYTRMVGWG